MPHPFFINMELCISSPQPPHPSPSPHNFQTKKKEKTMTSLPIGMYSTKYQTIDKWQGVPFISSKEKYKGVTETIRYVQRPPPFLPTKPHPPSSSPPKQKSKELERKTNVYYSFSQWLRRFIWNI